MIYSKVPLTVLAGIISQQLFLNTTLISILAPILSNLLNKSFAMGLFPKSIKRAKILPIFKNKDKLADTGLSLTYLTIGIYRFRLSVDSAAQCTGLGPGPFVVRWPMGHDSQMKRP